MNKKYTGKYACPFCGNLESLIIGDAEYIGGSEDEFATNDFAVCCSFNYGGCGAVGGYRQSVKDAVDNWERRA